jgi:hypothetical protein
MKDIFLIEIELNYTFRDRVESASYLMNQLLADGKIQTYGISGDLNRMWITTIAATELEIWELLGLLPIESVMEPIVTRMYTYNQSIELQFPVVSLN